MKKKPTKAKEQKPAVAADKPPKFELLPPPTVEQLKERAQEAGTALVVFGDNPLELKLPDKTTEAEYLAYGVNIGRAMEFAAWRVGDWVNFGMTKFSYKDYAKLAGITGLTEVYLRTCSSVAGRVEPMLRTTATLERARLMLARKNDNETVVHCFRRLATKSQDQLRQMAGTGNGGRKNGKTEITIDQFYRMCGEMQAFAAKLSADQWPVVAGYERAEGTGGSLDALRGELVALLDAIADTVAPKVAAGS